MRQLLLSISVLTSVLFNAQVNSTTVSMGPGYANQVFYQLENGTETSVSKSNWDLAFETSGQGTSILINHVTGVTLYQYPKSDTSGWSNLDTSGIATWSKRYNSDTTWSMGALGRYANTTNPYDLDWGTYNMITHAVTGDSLYVVKLASGAFKKLHIRSLKSGVYYFRYANLDGTSTNNVTITKTLYNGKNFAYYSLENNVALDREPLSANWDLVFTQYFAFIPTPYSVTGILLNKNVQAIKLAKQANATNYTNWAAHSFTSRINTIGYDWKSFNGSAFVVEDSLLYFVKTSTGDIWKIIPTGFGGSANGNTLFSKEKMSTSDLVDLGNTVTIKTSIYPNPCAEKVNLLISNTGIDQELEVRLFDSQGRIVYSERIQSTANQFELKTILLPSLTDGLYYVNISNGSHTSTQTLIIKK